MSVVCRATLPRLHQFTTTVIKYRVYDEKAEGVFKNLLLCQDWDSVREGSASDAAVAMNAILQNLYDTAFPIKTRKIKSTDKPWLTDKRRRLIRNKKRYYKKKGRTAAWRRKNMKIHKLIKAAKKAYIERIKKKMLEDNNSRCYFVAVKMFSSHKAPKRWRIQSMYPGRADAYIAEEAAAFFNGISQNFEPLEPLQAPVLSLVHLCPELHQVAYQLRHMRKPKSIVPGDIDPRLVTKFADLIAVPVHSIFQKVYTYQEWPQLWASETVTLIPKNSSPDDLSQLRNISCTPLFSKCLESFVLGDLKSAVRLSPNQFGGVKGVGVDHFLVDTWHEIMSGLEDPRACMSLMSIDFKKAFNTMCHKNCIESLSRLGATAEQRALVSAFLRNRVMRIKVGDTYSAPRLVPGGAPQGSVLGSFLFCAATDALGTDLSGRAAQQPVLPELSQPFELNGTVLSDSFVSSTSGSSSPPSPIQPPVPLDLVPLDESEDEGEASGPSQEN